jgi:hypothetical protein
MMKPWREKPHAGEYVLLMGQVPGDMSLRGLNMNRWLSQMVHMLERAGHRVKFRPHPKTAKVHFTSIRVDMQHINRMTPLPLGVAVHAAKWVVTYTSNSGVDAVMEGIPTVTCEEGAMAWDITGHNPCQPPPTPDRSEWCRRMGYTQWSPEEIKSGVAWDHLRVGVSHLC